MTWTGIFFFFFAFSFVKPSEDVPQELVAPGAPRRQLPPGPGGLPVAVRGGGPRGLRVLHHQLELGEPVLLQLGLVIVPLKSGGVKTKKKGFISYRRRQGS